MNDLKFFRLRQKFEGTTLGDPSAATRVALAGLPAARFIRPGMTVAVGAGSRGIANYAAIVRTVCGELKTLGARPFIVPAMGSHGGATDRGQREVLAHYGITEEQMGAPIRSSMEPVELGRAGGLIVYQDRNAAGADAIVLVNRIKPHTDFHGPIESGLMKMAAIGLGKQKGAQQFHLAVMRMGAAAALLEAARAALRSGKISFGVGIIENQIHQTVQVAAVPAAALESAEMKLLEQARALMPRLPFDRVDLLIVDEIGKNLSGSGMDTNIIRRAADGSFVHPGENAVGRIYVRSLHPDSYGNAAGIGMADFTHDRLVRALDANTTWVNACTALMPANARVPMHYPTDREALEAALQTTGQGGLRQLKALWIKNTLSCETLLASEAYLEEAQARSDLIAESRPTPLAFDPCGDLLPAFTEQIG
jgi:hypothetical protein